MKYQHSGNFAFEEGVNFEHPIGDSMTVPDMTMSLQELVSRNVRGLPVPGFQPSYNDEFVPDMAHMDLAERDDYIESLKEANRGKVSSLQTKLDERKSKRNARKDAERSEVESKPGSQEADPA